MKTFLISATLMLAASACASSPEDTIPEDPCPWTTSTGRKSCGARPPAKRVAPQPIARQLMHFETPMRADTDGEGTERTFSWAGLEAIDFSNHMIQLSLKTQNIARAAKFELVLGTDGFTNAFVFTLRSQQGQLWITDGRWVTPSLSWSPSSTIGAPSRARITDIMLRVTDDASSTPVTVELDGIALVREPVARYPRGVLSFTFDDNHDSMITEGAPRLDARGFLATAYVIIGNIDEPLRATLPQIQERHARGWDIAAHSFSFAAHNMRWTTMPYEVLEDDIVSSREWLMAQGFNGYDHCAYPGGDFTNGGTTDVLSLVDRYFTSCRTIFQRQREAAPPADAHKLRVFYITNSTTLTAAKAAVDDAIRAREWIIVVFHKLVENPAVSTEWRTSDFAAFVDHVAASGITVEPVTKVLAD
ncbi:MAG: polysaccharide deacetylase family protein [Myxococcota bacterium]|nr:polysaccharide deacetylase family protein [Myxococcota bacterium]